MGKGSIKFDLSKIKLKNILDILDYSGIEFEPNGNIITIKKGILIYFLLSPRSREAIRDCIVRNG